VVFSPSLLLVARSLLVCCQLLLPCWMEEEAEKSSMEVIAMAANVISATLMDGRSKRCRSSGNCDGIKKKARRVICWDHQRAKLCIDQDYLGPKPSFGPGDSNECLECLGRLTTIYATIYITCNLTLGVVMMVQRDKKLAWMPERFLGLLPNWRVQSYEVCEDIQQGNDDLPLLPEIFP
jgi:hypothetical protein